ncbi:KNTC1-like protein [Mya arenaria]|uniref:KNTC1-like protein n=1 Tax=Mya arenaria TaxID=6604 RepID=A0ABY7F8F6_MYAAR|nr:KNTC1-like protein [Mya arenaria]
MAEWDNIKTDFGGDETVNFGPRKESGSALYQIDTVATVSCQDLNNHSLPTVSSSLLGDLTCLAVDKTLLLNTASILSLDTPVEEVEWSPDGSVVVLGTSGGSVFMLDAESTDIIFSMNLVPPERLVNGKAFCRILFTDVELKVGEITTDGHYIFAIDSNKTRDVEHPEIQKVELYRILQKNKFEEAEQFANLFRLDIELVHKVKANYLIDQLSPWNADKHSQIEVATMIQQLWICLETIVLDKSASSKAPAERERVSEQYSKLLKIQRRLTTFKLAFGEKSFTGEVWRQFVEKNLLSEALRLLDQGQVDTAFIIWIRHQCQWTNQINRPLIQQLLSVLHDGVSSPDLLSYICDGLLPSVVREVPQALEDIVDFVIEKTKNLEVTHKDEWPKNAIQFADFSHRRLREASAVVLDDETCMATDNAHKTKVNMEEVLSPLAGLIVKLHQLDDVLHKYRCRLSLAQFLQDLLERYGQVQSFGGETAWEAKSAAILDCITDVEQKINGILEVMQFAPIPWSSRVEQLVQASLKLKHCKVESIREQCLHVEVKKLMMKYGFKNTEVPEGPEAEHLMYMMLSQDKPGCLEDAQQVKSCDPDLSLRLHTFRLRQLIAADRLEEGLELLRNLAPALGVRVGSAIVNLATVKLDYTVDISHIQDQINSEKRLYTDAAIHVLKYLQSREKDPLMIADLKEQESVLKNMRALQVEFSEYLTVVEYSSEEHRLEIMYNYIKEFYIALKKSPKTVSYAKVYRLAHILNIPHISILGQMAIRSANLGNINTAVQICRDLYESSHSQEVACTLMEVVRAFLDLLAEVDLEADTPTTSKLRLLPDVCCRLANQAVSICDPDCLCEYLEVCRACSLLQDVGRQCEAGDDSLSAQWGEGGDVHIDRELWADLSLDVFQEDALIMSSSIALPLVAKYIQLNPLYNAQDPDEEKPADERSAVDQMCTGVVPVVQHLRGNSHIQLALAFSVHMLHTLLKYTLQQDMGLTYTSEEEKAENVACQKAYTDLNRTSQAMLKELVFTLLMKIFSGSRVDEHLAFMYLSTRPKREVMDCMLRLTKTASQSSHKKLKISFRDAILGPNSEKTKLLPAIAQNPAADTKLVTEFCQAFKLDEDEGLLLYLDHLFVPGATSEPETEARNSNIARAYQAITRGLQLLEHLMIYTRVSSPSEYETEFKIGGDKKELSPDQICLTAVQNMVRVYTENFSSPDAGTDMSLWHWRPDQANSAFLQDLQQVLHSIKNCESSLACAKWMVNKLPLGSEKVLSAKKEKAMQAYLKFRSHWQKMASAQALCLNSLGEAELLQATDRPSQLIQRLYEHPSITDTAWDCSTQRPDIHTAAERIAHINNIHLDAIQHSLIENLENLKFAESMIEVKDSDEEINFRRIIHLVKRENRESNLLKLFDFALKPGDGRDTMCSIQALRCLLHLCDEATVKKECNKSLEDISVCSIKQGADRHHCSLLQFTCQSFISQHGNQILSNVKSLCTENGFNHGLAVKIEESVYEEILAGERFEMVLNSPQQKLFVAYCIREKNIDTLLVFSVKHHMIGEAKQLVGVYIGAHTDVALKVGRHVDVDEEEEDQPLAMLKGYLSMQGLQEYLGMLE